MIDSNLLNFCKIVNKSKGCNSRKNQLINEMVSDYNHGVDNLITRFSVLINTVDAKDIFINDSEESVKGVIDITRKYTAESEIEKSVQMYPNLMKSGDYITFKMNEYDEFHTCIITSTIEKKRGYDEGIFLNCNNILKWKDNNKEYSYYCVIANDSYGSKQSKSDDRIMTDDTKAKIIVQNNEDTRKIKKSQRFIFSNSTEDIYSVVDITKSIDIGIITLVCKKEVQRNEDDMENNIGYNKDSNIDYNIDIIGKDAIILNENTVFTVNNDENVNLVWSINNSNAIIVSSNNNRCIVKGLVRGKVFKLTCKDTSGNLISEKNIGITR